MPDPSQTQRNDLARYRSILAAALDPIITIDARGTIESASNSVFRVFGWTPEEIIGRNVNLLMPEPHHSRHDQYLRNHAETGMENILGRVREFEGRHKDGTLIPIDLCVSRVDIEGEEEPLFTAVIHDLRHRKSIEHALIASAQQLRTILEDVDLLGVGLSADGTILFANDSFLRATGYTREAVIGQNWFTVFIPSDDRERVLEVFQRAIHKGDLDRRFENHITTITGEHRLITWFNTVTHDARGIAVGVMSLGQDITEQRRTQEERRRHHDELESLVATRTAELESTHEQLRLADRLASIGTLAAGLGHDMNNVLLPIRCRLDALRETDLPKEVREHFIAVRESVEYLQQLTDGLHLLALDPDDPAASHGVTDIDTWWPRVRSLLSKALPRNATLVDDIPPILPSVAVPSHRLSQALLNLVVNAGESLREDGVVQIWAKETEDGRFVRVGVTDNGRGMTAAVRHRAIDPFFTTKTRGLGTGLGLSLVHGVVRAAGGKMEIDSAPNRGTTVMLLLPTATPVHPADVDAEQPQRARIDLHDRRLASLMQSMVVGAGFLLTEDDDVDLWVTESGRPYDDALRAHVGRPATAAPQVIILAGRGIPFVDHADVIVLDPPDDYERIRRCLEEACRRLRSTS
jgi:PAS domain S-box-containing protein